MKMSVMGLVSFSMVALVGLAGCMADGTGKDDPAPEATSARDDGPVAETSAALTGATDCGSFIRSHINWVQGQNNCSGGGYVAYSIVTHQSSGLVSLTDGWLDATSTGFSYINPITHTLVTIPSKLFSNNTSDGSQSFSDRTFQATITGETHTRWLEFDPRAEDQVKVTLSDDGKMIFKLVSWGGGEITVQPTECMNNLMYGFGNGVLYSVMLADECAPG